MDKPHLLGSSHCRNTVIPRWQHKDTSTCNVQPTDHVTKVKEATLAFIRCQVINHTCLLSFFSLKKIPTILITEETQAIQLPPGLSHVVVPCTTLEGTFHMDRCDCVEHKVHNCTEQPSTSPCPTPIPPKHGFGGFAFLHSGDAFVNTALGTEHWLCLATLGKHKRYPLTS